MALFGRRKRSGVDDGTADDWTAVGIHIVNARRPTANSSTFSSTTFDAVVDLVTDKGAWYDFILQVQPPGGEPYEVRHSERVPQKVTNPGMSAEQKVPDGIDLRGWVRADDPQKVAIDWTGYGESPEAKAVIADALQVDADHRYATHVLAKQKPAMQQTLRTGAWNSVSSLAQAVHDGQFGREEWELTAQSNLRKTLITQEQYDAAVAIAEGR